MPTAAQILHVGMIATVSSRASDGERDDFVAAGATHLLLHMGEPWNDDAVADLVRWRDARNQP